MIHELQHTITALAVRPPAALELSFADGAAFVVDLSDWAARIPSLEGLAGPDLDLFASARLDARGGYVVWIEDDLELAADNLRNLAVDQAGGIGHERLLNWLHETGLTQASAAEAIGISPGLPQPSIMHYAY